MKSELASIVDYLSGETGPDANRIRQELQDPQSDASRFLAASQQLSADLFGEPVLRALGLPPDAPLPQPPVRHGAVEAPSNPRRSRSWLPLFAVGAIGVVTALLWWDNRVRDQRVQAALAELQADVRLRERGAVANPPVRRQPDRAALDSSNLETLRGDLADVRAVLRKLEDRPAGEAPREAAPKKPETQAGRDDVDYVKLVEELAALRSALRAQEKRAAQSGSLTKDDVKEIVARALAEAGPKLSGQPATPAPSTEWLEAEVALLRKDVRRLLEARAVDPMAEKVTVPGGKPMPGLAQNQLLHELLTAALLDKGRVLDAKKRDHAAEMLRALGPALLQGRAVLPGLQPSDAEFVRFLALNLKINNPEITPTVLDQFVKALPPKR